MAKTPDSATEWDPIDSDWEELGDDNGDIITFEKGTVMFGRFLKRELVTLPVDRLQPGDDPEAPLLIFQGDGDSRWSVWETYQLREAFTKISAGDVVRIECTGERKAREGNVKIMSVKRRIS